MDGFQRDWSRFSSTGCLVTLALCFVDFSAQAQVLLTGRPQTFYYTDEAVQAAAEVAAKREYLEFLRDHTLSNNPRMQARLDALLKPILKKARVLRPRIASLHWRVLLVTDEAYTVASKASGLIVVSETYVSQTRFNDAELTFVLAHEVAHVAAEHVRELLSAVPRHYEPNVPISALRAAELLSEVRYMFDDMTPMYKRLDQEADLIGMVLVRQLGIPARRALSVFDKMARVETGHKMFDDHEAAANSKVKTSS